MTLLPLVGAALREGLPYRIGAASAGERVALALSPEGGSLWRRGKARFGFPPYLSAMWLLITIPCLIWICVIWALACAPEQPNDHDDA